jgi:competence protein ComEA
VGEEEPGVILPSAVSGPSIDGSGGGEGATIDINQADERRLESLPGIGPSLAAAIVEHREREGPFRSVDDLLDVAGIGPAKLTQLRPRASV